MKERNEVRILINEEGGIGNEEEVKKLDREFERLKELKEMVKKKELIDMNENGEKRVKCMDRVMKKNGDIM